MKKILVALDLSETTGDTLATALELAQSSQGTIMLIHVVEPPCIYRASSAYEYDAWEKEMIRANRALGQLLATIRMKGFNGSGQVVAGDPSLEILSHARDFHADVIVMGSPGHTTIYDLLSGSPSSRVLKAAPCPVMFSSSRKGQTANIEIAQAS